MAKPTSPPEQPTPRSLQELEADNASLRAENLKLRDRITELERLVDELTRTGKRQAAPHGKGLRKAKPAKPGRKDGPDHGTHHCRAVPERVDRVLAVALPPRCPHCDYDGLAAEETVHQYVEDLPEPATVITRYDIEVGRCGGCGQRVQARHPSQISDATGAAGVQIGPRALSLAAELNKVGGLSYAKAAAVLRSLGLGMSRSALCRALARLARRGEPTYDALKEAVAAEPVISPDETGWRVGFLPAWLWAFAAPLLSVYAITVGRGYAQARSVLPEKYKGTLVRDGWAPYRKYKDATHQSCAAHLLRRARDLRTKLPRSHHGFPNAVTALLKDALVLRDRRDAATVSPEEVATGLAGLEERLSKLLRSSPAHPDNRRFLRHLRRERDALFTFLRDPAVPATNHWSERAIRPAVVTRKNCGGGNRTWPGAHTQEVLMTILSTAAKQGKDPLAILIELLRSPVPLVADLIPKVPSPPRA